ncbi:MAG: phosphoenolpyruvate synthase, partial [Nitrospirae bacterium]
VAVQQMVDARASGVMFTIEPVTGDREKIVINASWGLGEAVVSGQITPDEYVVEKKSLSIVKRSIARKKRRIVYDRRGGTRWEDVPSEMQEEPALSDKQIVELARYGLEIERHYNCSQDIEWALDSKGRLYILQARPETVFSKEGAEQREVSVKPEGEVQILIRGLGVSPGYGSGRVRVVLDVKDISEFKEGEVLVTEMTTPDWVPAMKKAAAIITDLGGKTCHAAIVSRELGVPCVVGTERATKVLGEGQVVTVDGQRGLVFEGRLEKERPEEERAVPVTAPPVVTATKVYVNLSVPEIADRVASETGADGVGLLRAEHMMLSIGKHPRLLIQEGGQQLMIDAFSKGIAQVAEAFYPKPVVYRFLDFKPDEFLSLPGGERFEKDHVGPNPMIGFRGQFRYVKEDDLFRLELRAIKKVRDEMGFRNVWVMIPFVRTLEVFRKTVEIMHQEGLDNRREKDFQLWIMVEVPSACFMIDEFCREGIDGVSFGTNDLTMLVLGVDRNDASVQEIYDERNLAVLRAIAYTITVCRSYGVTTSICGQAPSVYPDYLEFMIRCGCTSVSVNPDAVRLTRQMVASVEEKIKLERALGLESAHRIAKIPMEEFFFWKKLPR